MPGDSSEIVFLVCLPYLRHPCEHITCTEKPPEALKTPGEVKGQSDKAQPEEPENERDCYEATALPTFVPDSQLWPIVAFHIACMCISVDVLILSTLPSLTAQHVVSW